MNRKIGIWGFFGTNNFGDDYLLQKLVSQLEHISSSDLLYVFSSSTVPDNAKSHIHYIPRSVQSSVAKAFELDILIIGPGGLLPNRDPEKIIFFILLALIMRLRGKKVGIVGMGVGDANFSKFYTRVLLNVLFYITSTTVIRHSLDGKIKLWKCNQSKVHTTLDYLMGKHNVFAAKGACEKGSVLFSLADIFSGHKEEREVFVKQIGSLVRKLRSENIPVTLVALTKDTDSGLNAEIANYVKDKEIKCLVYGKDDIDEIIACFAGAKITVAMRFHALVMALQYDTPTYTIAYSDKLEQLSKWAGIEEYMQRICVDAELYYEEIIRIDPNRIYEGICSLESRNEEIAARIHRQKMLFQENITECYEVAISRLLDSRT